ncbi:MAG: translation initiation factor IF-2, partial [Planctomycetaceae bacterium]|nr:translation initiation factor IF-2 [Planctomycetaceae bacterium]
MSIRIYALAKQLNIESKDLVDLCKKLGFDKASASALASLSDDEVEKVKASLAKSTKSGTSTFAPVAPPKRPTNLSQSGRVPVLKPTIKHKSASETPELAEVAEKPTAPPTDVEQFVPSEEVDIASQTTAQEITSEQPDVVTAKFTVTEDDQIFPPPELTTPVGTAILAPVTVEEPPDEDLQQQDTPPAEQDELTPAIPELPKTPKPNKNDPTPNVIDHIPNIAAIRKEKNYVSPMRSILNKVPLLGRRKPKSDDSDNKHGTGTSSKSSGPMIRLAPVPKTPANRTPKKPAEPAPQKPDMKLPKEAIRAAAMGTSRPLDEHIRKHEEKQKNLKDGKDKDKGKEKDKGRRGKAADKSTAMPVPFIQETGTNRRKGPRTKSKDELVPNESALATSPTRKRRSGAKRRHAGMEYDAEESFVAPRQLRRPKKSQQINTAAPRKSDLVIQLPCTVKQFAEQTGLSVAVVLRKLIELEMPMIITSPLDEDAAELLSEAFDLRINIRPPKSLEDEYVQSLLDQIDPPEDLKPRPPVVTFLGHVDHGKTSLLDRILSLDVVSGEKGGITQHIRAYRITTPNGDVTFVDTPGHEAFTEMRARGANCTDIVVLVVAADDGVMPQTEEAISHAKAAGVPIVVALNKCDLPSANLDRAMQSLATHDILPSEWGGDVEVVKTSAITGDGIDTLLDTLLMVAELSELKANPNRAALGVALESEMQSGQGVIAKVLVQNGTLRTGDVVLCGAAHGRVKAMHSTLAPFGKLTKAEPGTPVQLIGLDVAPAAGGKFCVLDDVSIARQIAQDRAEAERSQELADMRPRVTLENLFQRISEANEVQTLNIIIRADVRGSIEAIRKELGKLDHPEVKIRILQASVGGITEADVQLADASEGIIVGFNVVPDENARVLAEKLKIQVRRYDIIYNLANDIRAALEGMLKPLSREKELGRILVQRTFVVSRLGTIAGCRVLSGTVERDCRIRIIRENRIIGDYALDSLKREKDDAKEVREGYECGIKLKG